MGCNKKPQRMEVGKPELKELSGWIIEDVWIDKYEDWEPHIQAIKHDNGDLSLRSCYWLKEKDGNKKWVYAPMFVYEWTIEDLREEIQKAKADIIKMLLRKYVE